MIGGAAGQTDTLAAPEPDFHDGRLFGFISVAVTRPPYFAHLGGDGLIGKVDPMS